MSEQRPHKDSFEEQFRDLPLPDENLAWQKMEMLLEEEKDNKPFLPFYFRSCMSWILLVALVTALWFIYGPHPWQESTKARVKKENPEQEVPGTSNVPATSPDHPVPDKMVPQEKEKDPALPADFSRVGQPKTDKDILSQKDGDIPAGKKNDAPAPSSQTREGARKEADQYPVGKGSPTALVPAERSKKSRTSAQVRKESEYDIKKNKKPSPNTFRQKQSSPPLQPAGKRSQEKTGEGQKPDGDETSGSFIESIQDTTSMPNRISAETGSDARDTAAKVTLADTMTKKPVDSTLDKKPEGAPAKPPQKRPSYYYAAGISVQQQVPLAGQKAVPYNYYGRKGSLADYMPSVYARLYKEDHWFAQAEFRYGAPQSVKEFTYNNEALGDSGNFIRISRSQRLKKTFYHQVPVSFNYYIHPNLSIGGGFMYSRFQAAVTEESVKRQDIQSGVVLSESKSIVHINSTDSFFTKSQMHLSLESQYAWKRLSLGLRYTFGLQPYIRYIDNAGIARQEKNRNLNVFLRFQVWSSGKD